MGLSIKSSNKPKIKKFHKRDPPKMEILIQNTISKFSKPKIKLKKDPLKLKKSKTYIRRPQIKKFYKTDPPPKVGILIQNTISNFSKTKHQNKKTYIKRPQIKKFYKTDPPKWEF